MEFPGYIVEIYLINWSLLGRKGSLSLTLIMTSLFTIISILVPQNYFIYFISIARFWMSMAFIITITYTLEIYNTDVRTYGLGICNFVGRIAGIIFPVINS